MTAAAERGRALAPFDVLRATRSLAPADVRLNDLRWLTGQGLRRLSDIAAAEPMRSPSMDRVRGGAGSEANLAQAAIAARARLRLCECEVGAASWPIVRRVVLEDGSVRDCRPLVPDIITPWRVDAVITDRLRVALDRLYPLLSVGDAR